MTSEPTDPIPTNSFLEVAPYYDFLMKSVPYRMWVEYYQLLLAHQDVQPMTLLDVCCGTGTMCEMLHKCGYQVSGVDLSPAMIVEAQSKAKRRKLPITYQVGDAATFDMGQQFDGALSFFDSLNNILDPRHLQSAISNVFRHLEPGGSFVFDLNTAYAFEMGMFDQQELRANAKLKYVWTGDWDEDSRVITVKMRFWHKEQEFLEIHRQRAYELEDVLTMLEEAGFVKVRVFHSYTLNPPRAKSDRLHFSVRKPAY